WISSNYSIQKVSLTLARFLASPAGLCRFRRDLRAFPGREFSSARRAAFETAQTSQLDSGGVLSLHLGRIRLRNLAGRFKHDTVCKFVRIARTCGWLWF